MRPDLSEVRPCDCGQIVPDEEHHCWWHHAKEVEDGEVVYRICPECWHVYRTPEDLIEAWKREVATVDGEMLPPPPRNADDIGFCQECIHDF